ncbi:MAG: c-type cytochrome, partial [Anaerolineales bacterium]
MSERKLIILGLVSIMLLGLAACGPSSKPDPTALPYTPMAWDQPTATAAVVPSGDAEAGAVVFEQYCQQCHSLEEDVNIAGPSLFDAGEILTMDYVQQSIIDPHA